MLILGLHPANETLFEGNAVSHCPRINRVFLEVYPMRSGSVHYNDVIMGSMASQITSLAIVSWAVYSGTDQRKHQSTGSMASQITSLVIVSWAVYSGTDQRKHQSFMSLAFVRGIHRGPVNSPHKWPVTRKMFPFDDIIMSHGLLAGSICHCLAIKAPSQYKDRLIYVWRFPC